MRLVAYVQVSFEETFRLIFTKNHTSVIAGDLLDMTGISKEITLPMKIASYESSPSPGVTIGFDMVMDIALPVTLVAEGACELLVKVSMKVCHPCRLCCLRSCCCFK